MAKRKREWSTLHSYPGWLGRPADVAVLSRAGRDAAAKFMTANPNCTDDEFMSEWQAGADAAAQSHRHMVLVGLVEHFGLDPRDKDWGPKLAWKLMMIHVPASKFAERKARGRPRSDSQSRNALVNMRRVKPRRERSGAPKKWGEKDYRTLLALVERGNNLLSERGAPRITNKAALRAVYQQWRRDGLWADRTAAELNRFADADARRVSDARKALRKPTQK